MSLQFGATPSRYSSVLRALEGFRNVHAMGVLVGGFVLVGLIVGLGASTGSGALMALIVPVALVLANAVFHAAGLAMMDAARGRPRRGFVALLVAGAMCFLKFLAIALIAMLGFGAYVLVEALLLYLCKIPLVGPLLLIVVVPVGVLLTALLMAALFVGASLVAPALWEGNSIMGALSRLAAVASRRPLEVIVSLILLGLLTGVVSLIVGGFVFGSTVQFGGLTAAVFGHNMTGGLSLGDMVGLGGYGGLSGYGGFGGFGGINQGLIVGGLVGLMIVWLLVSGAIAAMQLNGLCHIYLQASEGLDDARAREHLDKSFSQAKEMIGKAGSKVAGAARELSAKVDELSKSSDAPTPADSAGSRTCPGCRIALGPDDRFCGECGTRL